MLAAVLATAHVTPPAALARPGEYHVYAHGFMSDALVGYSSTDSGSPQRIPMSATSGLASWPQVASPDGRLLYGASTLPPRLFAHSIGADGSLTRIGAPIPMPDVPIDITFTPDGKRAYVVLGLVNTRILTLKIAADGVPRKDGEPVPLRGITDGIPSSTISPDGRTLYVASYFHDEIVRIPLGADGRPNVAKQARARSGAGPIYPTMTRDGKRLYVANERAGSIEGYAVAGDGGLTPVPGSPFRVGLLPHVMSITPDGEYLYMPNQGSTHLSTFAIRGDGSLRALPDVPFGHGPIGAMAESTVISPSGRSLWALGPDPLRLGSNILRRYRVGADGGLTADTTTVLDTGTLAASGRSLTLAPGR